MSEVFKKWKITISNAKYKRIIWKAMATGIPIVCANYPGADQFFNNGEVQLFEQNNKHELVEKILKLSDKDTLRKKTIQSAYQLLGICF